MTKTKVELTDEELDLVTGGTNYRKKQEIELGDFVPDAYKKEDKKTDLNNVNLTKFNTLNEPFNIDNNYEPYKDNTEF